MMTYRKVYTVQNTLVTYEIWDKHQTQGWKSRFGTNMSSSLFDVTRGVAQVYYHDIFETFRRVMEVEYEKDPSIFIRSMDLYEEQLDEIHALIAKDTPLSTVESLIALTKKFQDAWIGLDLSYMPDFLPMGASAERRSAAAREKAFGFYIGADRLIRRTIQALYPEVGVFADVLRLDEIRSGKLPSQKELEARAAHFIYFKDHIHTDISFNELCRRESLRIESIYSPLRKEVRGQTSSPGFVRGSAYIYHPDKGKEMPKSNVILIAANLYPRDLSLVSNAKAIILDEGDYYSPAVIATRLLNKPCLFATRIASHIFADGDRLEVDGESGRIRLLTK